MKVSVWECEAFVVLQPGSPGARRPAPERSPRPAPGRRLRRGRRRPRAARPCRLPGRSRARSREFAAEAGAVYDQVLTGKVEDVLDDLDGPFDTLLAYDLLEHLVQPERRAASAARRRRGGRAAARLRSECPALVARSRSRRARHVRLHRLGAPRPNAPALADARDLVGAARVDRLARRGDRARSPHAGRPARRARDARSSARSSWSTSGRALARRYPDLAGGALVEMRRQRAARAQPKLTGLTRRAPRRS